MSRFTELHHPDLNVAIDLLSIIPSIHLPVPPPSFAMRIKRLRGRFTVDAGGVCLIYDRQYFEVTKFGPSRNEIAAKGKRS
jgi:hypothetical protein